MTLGYSIHGKKTWVGSHCFFQGDLPDPGIEPGSPALQADFYYLSHWEGKWISDAFSWICLVPKYSLFPTVFQSDLWVLLMLSLLNDHIIDSWGAVLFQFLSPLDMTLGCVHTFGAFWGKILFIFCPRLGIWHFSKKLVFLSGKWYLETSGH